MISFLSFAAGMVPVPTTHHAAIAGKQPQTIHTWAGLAVFQYKSICKTSNPRSKLKIIDDIIVGSQLKKHAMLNSADSYWKIRECVYVSAKMPIVHTAQWPHLEISNVFSEPVTPGAECTGQDTPSVPANSKNRNAAKTFPCNICIKTILVWGKSHAQSPFKAI